MSLDQRRRERLIGMSRDALWLATDMAQRDDGKCEGDTYVQAAARLVAALEVDEALRWAGGTIAGIPTIEGLDID